MEQSSTRTRFVPPLVVLFLFSLLAARRSPVGASFIAEDGAVFFRDQLAYGFGAFTIPVAGYLQTLPRVIAFLLSFFPTSLQPSLFTGAAHLILATAFGTLSLPRYRFLIQSDALRTSAAVIIVAAFQGTAVVGTAFNLYWFLWPFALLPLFDPAPATWLRRFFDALIIVLITLSAPILVLALPIAAFQVLRCKDHRRMLGVLFIVLTGLQMFIFLHTPQPDQPSPIHLELTWPAVRYFTSIFVDAMCVSLVYRCVLTAVAGQALAQWLAEAAPSVTKILFSGCTLIAVLTIGRAKDKRMAAAGALYLIGATIAAPLYLRNLFWFFVDAGPKMLWDGERYFLPSFILSVFLIALLLESFKLRPVHSAAILVAVFSLGIYGNFSVEAVHEPSWKESARAIDRWREGETAQVTAPIYPPGWTISLTREAPHWMIKPQTSYIPWAAND